MNQKARQQRTFFSHFILERIHRHVETVYNRIWRDKETLRISVSPSCRLQSSFSEAKRLHYHSLEPGDIFAQTGWNTVWFTLNPPKGASHILWEVNGESTIFFAGEPWCGLDTAHRWARIPDGANELYIRCSTYETGLWMRQGEAQVPPPVEGGIRFFGAYSAVRNHEHWKIYNDLLLIDEYLRYELERLKLLSPDVGKHKPLDVLPSRLRKLLHNADLALDTYDEEDFESCSEQLSDLLEHHVSLNGSLSLIGNSHLDLVWLWPEGATREKNIHTCSTILRLMEDYPELTFTMSQPWLLDALKEDAPPIYRQVRKRIIEERWELTGGMYVEPDTLLPCGEALVRASLLGQEVFQRETGSLCSTLWLPDVFGYSQSLPQIASAAGIDSFYTTKLLWSSMTTFPYSSFVWQGLDGSELLCHVSQVGYESRAGVEELIRSSEANKQAALFDDAVLAVGFGDGGGGVTEEQCERVRRIRGFSDLPSASWQRVDDFFRRLSDVRDQLPRYRGELYLEYHRGTFTTNHAMKRAYRKAEKALQTTEAAAVCTEKRPELSGLWKKLVFAEFHDALPGSSIAMVYEELIPQLQELSRQADEISRSLLSSDSRTTAFFNPSGIAGSWLVLIDKEEVDSASSVSRDKGMTVPFQRLRDGQVAALVTMQGLSTCRAVFVPMPEKNLGVQTGVISSERSKVHFSPDGFLSRLIIDGERLQLTAPCRFKLYPDHPANYDAWEIDRSVKNIGALAFESMKLHLIDDGPLVTRLQTEGFFGRHSSLQVTYSVVKDQPYLFVSVRIDWQEEHTLLTYELPTGYTGLTSRFGTPFGSIDRLCSSGPVQNEVMWEVPASRWLAVLDGMHRGLAVISADSYGCSVHDGIIELSLLRSPCSADEKGIREEELFADKAVHTFEFAIGPYYAETKPDHLSTPQAADTLFLPPVYTSAEQIPPRFTVKEAGTLTVSWIKPADTRKGYIIRLHETAGTAGKTVIKLNDESSVKVLLVDLLERQQHSLEVLDNCIHLHYSPYELLSVLVTPP